MRLAAPLLLLSATALAGAQQSSAAPAVTSASSVVAAVVPALVASSTITGLPASSTTVKLDLVLTRNNAKALDAATAAATTPGSASYHHFLTPDAFGQTYGATPAVVGAAVAALAKDGVTATVPTNHLMLQVSVTVEQADQLFGTTIKELRTTDGRAFFANTSVAHVPAELKGLVTSVVGLDTANLRTPKIADSAGLTSATPAAKPAYTALPAVYACPTGKAESNGGFLGEDLSAAYNTTDLYNAGFSGQGMTIALVEYADYVTGDAAAFESCEGISPDPMERRFVDGGTGSDSLDNSGNDEADLDIDVVMEMLPKIAHVEEYTAPNTDTSELDLYSAFADDDNAPVLSSSWGYCEDGLGEGYRDAYTAITEQAAIQGQQILDAAGDSGNMDCSVSPAPLSTTVTAELQSSDPYNTGVGGTSLTYPFPTQMESTWSGGGGAVSKYVPVPDYQKAAAATTGQTTATAMSTCGAALCRTVPDVSADADPTDGYAVYCSPCALVPSALVSIGMLGWADIGGTSASTPLWASITLLMDQEAKSKGLGTIGFLNPLLYQIYADPTKYANDFYDITSGNNGNAAGTGYDMASGLGSPNAGNLATDLVALASQVVAVPSTQNAYGYVDGPATAHSLAVSTGLRSSAVSITSDEPWLTAPASVTAPGAVTVTTTPGSLAAGTYTGHLTLTGGATYTVTYVITPPATLAVSPSTLAFATRVKGGGTQTCTSTWDDDATDAGSEDPNSLKSITVGNTGASGSVLHYTTEFVTDTGGLWLNPDASATGTADPADPTGGAVTAGGTSVVKLAAYPSFTVPATPPGTWTGSVIVRDLADPSSVITVPATLVTGDGLKTPTIAGNTRVVVPAGMKTTVNVPLTDSAGSCGYDYSAAADAPWVSIDDPDYGGEVAATGTPALGTGLLPLVVDATDKAPGSQTVVRVSSVQVSNQPFLITVVVADAGTTTTTTPVTETTPVTVPVTTPVTAPVTVVAGTTTLAHTGGTPALAAIVVIAAGGGLVAVRRRLRA